MELSTAAIEIFSEMEQKWLRQYDTKKTRLLSIDGGGTTTAAVACAALVHLESQIQKRTGNSDARIADFFDIVAGTGIGALLAAMIVADAGSGRPLFSAGDVELFLKEKQEEMFRVKKVGVFRRRFSFCCSSMDRVLKAVFRRDDGKDLTLRNTCKPLLVPCFDLNSSAPFVFSRADAEKSPSFDFELWKVIRATSATPSMFKPYSFASVDGRTSCLAVDGGLVMNNPTAAAITHVLHNKRDFPTVTGVDDILVLSIGNGSSMNNNTSIFKYRGKGQLSTASVVGIAMDGVSDSVDQMLANAFRWNPENYLRIQANGGAAEVLTEKAVESLPLGGKRLVKENNGQRMEGFVQRLVSNSLPQSPYNETAVTLRINGR